VKGQVCCFIIDGGSCNDIVSTLLVEKLSLQPRHHPHPYHMCDSFSTCKLGTVFVSVKYVLVSVKLMCVYVKLLKT
jgi:hypothetical protein